ncbi:phosphatidylethanolamine-binding protein [Podospora australis]|uniref:Phosphatidylethanolamine-binding protein n=1 Tax=Podospora australis TaxID=1536484 RepID=A0AAN6WN69_9PEZI|nr:phosphatidylethanolamine-binding protein [Podospora australis]
MMRNPPSSITDLLDELSPLSSAPPRSADLRIHFPETTVKHPGVQLSRQETAPTPTFSVSATALSKNLTLPNCDLSPVSSHDSSAENATDNPAETANEPTSTEPDAPTSDTNPLTIPRFLVATIDLDPPFPSFPVLGPILHGMQADLALSTTATEDPENQGEFIPLEHDKNMMEHEDEGESVAGYVGPSPPPLGNPHRYLSLLWEQPRGLNSSRIREELGLREHGAIGAMKRMWWDQEDFERRLGLGKVLAGNYFVV